jgi:hypothetical protein
VTASGLRRYAFLLVGSGSQLLAWLLIRPDLSEAQWAFGGAFQVWLGIEIALAVVLGWVAPDGPTTVLTILAGWLLQVVHFAAFGEHYGSSLWGLAVFLQVALAALAVGVALLARRFIGGRRR